MPDSLVSGQFNAGLLVAAKISAYNLAVAVNYLLGRHTNAWFNPLG